jgi:AmiR/NasT family two-component response regulator
MAVQRVFVIWVNPIFRESVRLLLRHPDVEWIGEASDVLSARDEIRHLQPDTVLIEEVEDKIPVEAIQILDDSPTYLRIIRLSLADNRSSVYHRELRQINKSEDLLRLIRGDRTLGGDR